MEKTMHLLPRRGWCSAEDPYEVLPNGVDRIVWWDQGGSTPKGREKAALHRRRCTWGWAPEEVKASRLPDGR
jgi:hypothetical protein